MKNTKINQQLSENFRNIPKSFIREILNVAGSEQMISFAGGLPNPDYFPVKALAEATCEVFENKGNELLQYSGSSGYLPLREWIAKRYNKNDIDKYLEIIREAYKRQCSKMQKLLEKYMPEGVQFTKPGGGMFLWLDLPEEIDAMELVKRTMKKNVVFVPGISFFVSSNGRSNVRMNFSNASEGKMEEGIRIIAAEMKEMIQRVKV
jgi:DNA-binding transcriptional MocR family regulator